MKKKLLLLMFALIIQLTANSQVTGFKINTLTAEKLNTENTYKTIDIIRYNYDSLEVSRKKPKLEELYEQLYNDSRGGNSSVYSDSIIRVKTDSIKLLTKDIEILEKHKDSLYYLYTKDYLKFKKSNILSFGSIRSKAFFDILYDNEGKRFKALGNSGVNFGNNTGSIYSELVSGNLGLFRVSLGSMISSNNNSDENEAKNEEAYQRLVTYGGNTVLNLEYPLAYVHSANNQYNFISRLIVKGTADLPAFGTTTEKWAGSGSIGLDFYGDASLNNNSLRFFFNFNINQIYGTDTYRDNLGINEDTFNFGQLSLGFVFLENFKVSFIVTTFSSEENLRNRNVVAGGQVLR